MIFQRNLATGGLEANRKKWEFAGDVSIKVFVQTRLQPFADALSYSALLNHIHESVHRGSLENENHAKVLLV